MRRRDELWPTVNVRNGVVTEIRWGIVPEGSRGTLRRIGHRLALIEFDSDVLPVFERIPIVGIRPSDEVAAERHRRQHGEFQ